MGILDTLQFHLSSGRLTSISMDRVPLRRPIVEELADMTSLLGFPDHVIATEIQGVYPPTFDLELVYLSSGLELTYIGDLASVNIAGESRDGICLSAATRRDVMIFLTSDLSWMIDDPFDWARRMGMQEGELFTALLQKDQCVLMNP